MASLLESGASGVAVEFVQDGCNQSEGYVDDSSNTHGQEAGTVRSSLPGSVHLHHTVVQSMGGAIQQHPIAMEGQSGGGSEVAVTPVAVATTTDLSHVLNGLQHSGELSSVLQQQPHLVEDLSAIAAGEVSMDPENLRFQYEMMEESEPTPTKTSKRQKPVVYREQDRFLPIHNVARIMRNAIPRNGKVSKDAKECMQECVSEFVSFITSEASDKCIAEKRKTITGDDILVAMATLGFDNYIEPLKVYLQKYREFTKAEKVVVNGGGNGTGAGGGLTGLTSMGGHVNRPQTVGVGSAEVMSASTGTPQNMATVYSSGSYQEQLQQLTDTT